MKINTASGAIDATDLGRTLMHEHLLMGFPGWEGDSLVPVPSRSSMIQHCVDSIAELKAAGISSLLDPCPNDLGRDVDFLAEVSARTSFNIIFATGLYHGDSGGAYWRYKVLADPDGEKRLRDLFVHEITEGVRDTGLKAGVIKVATAHPPFGDYEKAIFRAAAAASLATGTPITTHTDGLMGDEQLQYLTLLGVPAHQIIIGHSCGNPDTEYHLNIVERGAYIGFDRFGLEAIQADSVRIESMMKLVAAGYSRQIIVSHDCGWCSYGQMLPKRMQANIDKPDKSLHFSRVIAPKLIEAGLTPAQIDELLRDNPYRYFTGDAPSRRENAEPAAERE